MKNPPKSQGYRKPIHVPILPGQQPLFGADAPDPAREQVRRRDLDRSLEDLRAKLLRRVGAVDMARRLLRCGIQLPDVAQALGLPPVIERASRPLNPWKIRPGSNIEIVVGLLEAAGRHGVSEDEAIAELRARGRLKGVDNPRRAVHWTFAEIRKRTALIGRGVGPDKDRWYAYGTFGVWRAAAKISEKIKTGQDGDDAIGSSTPAPADGSAATDAPAVSTPSRRPA